MNKCRESETATEPGLPDLEGLLSLSEEAKLSGASLRQYAAGLASESWLRKQHTGLPAAESRRAYSQGWCHRVVIIDLMTCDSKATGSTEGWENQMRQNAGIL